MTLRHEMARLALLIGSIVSVRAANANAHTVPGHPRSARDWAARDEMYAAVRAYVGAERIPAFARKYGMKCSACHLAVPVLNAYGQAFKDNGYRMKNGTDDLRANEPGYWPVFAWLWKNYALDVDRVGGQTVQCRADTGLTVNGKPLKEPYLDPATMMADPSVYPCLGSEFGPVTVPPERLWVMGDNRTHSADSRAHCTSTPADAIKGILCTGDPMSGTVPVANVIGKARFIVWPPARWGGVASVNPQQGQ